MAYETRRETGTTGTATTAHHLVAMKDLHGYKVAGGDPDVRKWDVLGRDGRRLGKVDDLIVDKEAQRVRYLDVDLDHDLLGADRRRHVLLPIGVARLDKERDNVLIDQLDATEATLLPEYRHEAIDREWETELRRRFDRAYTPTTGDYYSHELYDEDRFYSPRRRE
jgi:photosynthetic reaction center H subunit